MTAHPSELYPTELVLNVGPNSDGIRLDRFLAIRLPWRSRTSILKLFESGQVQVLGRDSFRKSTKLKRGQKVRIDIPPPPEPEGPPPEIAILWEDEHLVAIDKPAGVIVHPTAGHRTGTLINYLHDRYGPDGIHPKLCHRLDGDTSGVILVAKSDPVRQKMQTIFEAREVEKGYVAITTGAWKGPDKGMFTGSIGPDTESPIKMKMVVCPNGDRARTHFEVLETLSAHTLFRLQLDTGRQHQIRVHLSHEGYPILCDKLYAPESPPYFPPESPFLTRHALHAETLSFSHPMTKEPLTITSPLPGDISHCLDWLREAVR